MISDSRQRALEEFGRVFPSAEILPEANGACRLLFDFQLYAEFEGVTLAEDFGLEILLDADFPGVAPMVKETSNVISPTYEHFFADRWFCLGINGELVEGLICNPSLVSFLEGPVTSYLYTALFYQRYGRYPYGDRPHDAVGIMQFYSDRLEAPSDIVTLCLMREIVDGKYHGKSLCPCGSGKATRSCHGDIIRPLMSKPMRDAVARDFAFVVNRLDRLRKMREALSLVDAGLYLPS
ncbi:hypothetical protein [Adlercreutzia caecimuris]|uniref:hypothetical protein n=1 Tax=Adlercreutzia caecimuris TaxID=671266 RepID=UPI00272979EB|nr:hypothetical protein [Adlercreutzia caecimuris]